MTDRQSTHGPDCWSWGPKHYDCAVREIERLRAEVERLKSMTAVTMGVGSGDGSLFVHGDYDSIKAAQALVFRAERLEDALRQIAEWPDGGNRYGQENIKRFAKATIDEAMEEEIKT